MFNIFSLQHALCVSIVSVPIKGAVILVGCCLSTKVFIGKLPDTGWEGMVIR